MRTFVLLCSLGLAAAGPSLADQGDCLVDGTEAVSDLMDSAMFIWASIARCGHDGETVKCEIAIASAVESVNGMINVILKAVDKCEGLKTENKKCGLAASTLTRGIAGLSAAAGGIIQKCFDNAPAPAPVPAPAPPPAACNPCDPNCKSRRLEECTPEAQRRLQNFAHADPVFCTVNLKSTAKSLFKAIKSLMKVTKKCEPGTTKCAGNAMKVVEAFAGLGEYLSGALGHCTHTLDAATLGCSQHISMLMRHIAKVSEGGIHLSEECGDHGSRRRRRRRKSEAPALPSSPAGGFGVPTEPATAPPPALKAAGAPGADGDLVYEIEVPNPAYEGGRRRRRRKSSFAAYTGLGRKYEVGTEKMQDNASAPLSVNLLLGAFLPVTAIVSFVGGRIFGQRRSRVTDTRTPREFLNVE